MKPKRKKISKVRRARIDKRKALQEWSRAVRARDKHCLVCGTIDHLNAHHLLAKEYYKALMFELDCGITLCSRCHKFGPYSSHRNGIWFTLWLQRNRPEQYQWAVDRIGQDTIEKGKTNFG